MAKRSRMELAGMGMVGLVVGLVSVVTIATLVRGCNEAAKYVPERPPDTARVPAPAPVTSPAPRAEPSPAPPALPAATAPPINVTPEQLRKAYDANEVSADDRYLGKVLMVTGIVTAVRKDVLDEPFVELATSNQFMSVHARFAVGADGVLREFLRGDKIIVRCVGNNVTIGSPQVKECVLQHHYRRGNGQ